MIHMTPDMLTILRNYHRTSSGAGMSAMGYKQAIIPWFLFVKDHLPKKKFGKVHILDIGCGLAGPSLFLHRHYGRAKLTLLDRDGIDDMEKGRYHRNVDSFGKSGVLDLARKFLVLNDVPQSDIKLCDIDTQKYPKGKFDVVFSALSCGFHYPVSVYANKFDKADTVILDIREGTENDVFELLGKPVAMKDFKRHKTCIWKR